MVRSKFRRRYRWWPKKRGSRRTGSRLLGSLGEALFFGLLFLLGALALGTLLAAQISGSTSDMMRLGYGFGFWVLVLVSSSFLILGGGGFVFAALRVGTSRERRSALAIKAVNLDLISEAIVQPRDYPFLPSDHDLVNSPGIKLTYRLPTHESPGWRLAAAAAFCLLWTGISAALLVIAVNKAVEGKIDGILSSVVVPFLGVAVWSIWFLFRQMSALTLLGPTIVEIARHRLQPGQACEVFLSQSGHIQLKRFALRLVCEEEATYQQGTDIRVERLRVVDVPLREEPRVALEPGQPFEFKTSCSIPVSAMHSFQSPHNRVLWSLRVQACPEGGKPFERSFPIIVYPAGPALGSSSSNVTVERPRAVVS
jgi:hypothetical protein